jgi:type II secretory pathway predicted ATPase ExeA/septal ring-binding cell division protein DamX
VALYLEHFGLSEPPFRITPHTDFFFEGAERGTTLEALTYAVLHDEGIVKVSGEVGSGKTMLCRMLMERLPGEVDTIYLATPSLASEEILQAIADDLDLRLSERRTAALRELQEHLIRLYGAGRRVVILVDEAHVMPEDTLEQVRLLSNLESNRHKLLQIVLFGQPELDETLAKTSLRQLRDRITHSFRMRPLATAEVAKYLSFRMRAAGYRGPELFPAGAAARIARASSGLTRRINILADKALLAAYTENTHAITERHVKAAVADSEFSAATRRREGPLAYIAAALLAGLALGAGVAWWYAAPPKALPPPAPQALSEEPVLEDEDLAAVVLAEEAAPQADRQPQPRLSPDQLRRLQGYSPAGQRVLAERLAATRELLESAAGEHYALELFVTENSDPARMERFLLRAREMVPLSDVYVVPAPAAGRYRLRVLYGNFASAAEADAASRALPPKYQREFHVVAHSFEDLRRQL